jgi:hypothetical protein
MKSILLMTALLAACGGGDGNSDGSGVDGGKQIVDLTSTELADVCEYLTMVLPERTISCPEGPFTVAEGGYAECVDDYGMIASESPDCTLTVSQTEACVEALAAFTDAQWCNLEALPTACMPVFDAACQ